MNWTVIVTRPAERAFRKMQKRDSTRIAEALRAMQNQPMAGDIVALRGVHKGSYRCRVGVWRLIF